MDIENKILLPSEVLKSYMNKYGFCNNDFIELFNITEIELTNILTNRIVINNELINEFAFIFQTNKMFWKKLNINLLDKLRNKEK